MLLCMRNFWLVSTLVLAMSAPLHAQLDCTNAATQAKCAQYERSPLPPEAALIPAPKRWPECVSYRLYSGIGVPVDFGAARRCAWSERLALQAGLQPQDSRANIFGGSAMLSEIYANGAGTAKDPALALRFACEAGGAPAEIEDRVASLEARRDHPEKHTTRFDFCEATTSGFMMGACAGYGAEIQYAKQNAALQKLETSWTAAQRSAFDSLSQAQQAYATAVGNGEVDLSGTARGMFATDAEARLRADFVAAIEAFEAGKLPHGGSAEAKAADAELNRVYRKQLVDAAAPGTRLPGQVQPEGIRKAERAWIVYRDSWLGFAKLRYPSVAPDAWLALLSRDRVRTMRSLSCDDGPGDEPCRADGPGPHPLP